MAVLIFVINVANFAILLALVEIICKRAQLSMRFSIALGFLGGIVGTGLCDMVKAALS